jgi:hypothetical protein
MVTKAVVYVQADKFHASAARCLDHCNTMRYELAGLICGDWPAAVKMLNQNLAEVIVVASPTQLDAAQEPRVEVVPKRTPSRRRSSTRPRLVGRIAAR